MARTARRTVAKVKSSAMIPRQPEVPNLMGEVAMVGIFYLVPRVSCRVGDKEMGGSGMEKAAEFRVVLVTCGSTKEARKIATAVVEKGWRPA